MSNATLIFSTVRHPLDRFVSSVRQQFYEKSRDEPLTDRVLESYSRKS